MTTHRDDDTAERHADSRDGVRWRAVSETLLPTLGAPARRALHDAGITDLHGLARHTERDVAALRGMGPKALATVRDALAEHGLEFRRPDDGHEVDEYLTGLASPHRETLGALRATLRTIVPHADEAIRYQMPVLLLDGVAIAGYAAFRDHGAYFPMSGAVLDAAGPAVAKYPRTKGGLRFPADKGLPGTLVAKLVRLRLAELSTVTDGVRRDYYPDGALKAVGRMKDGELHGNWRWYRSDGSLMRTGSFSRGLRTGTWDTWERDGTLVKRTRY